MYYYFVDNTVRTNLNTGVQRVVRRLAAALVDNGEDIAFVRLDKLDKLRLINRREKSILEKWNGPNIDDIKHDGSLVTPSNNNWLIVPEITSKSLGGSSTANLISFAKKLGLKIVYIFYDAIPLRLIQYSNMAKDHIDYMTGMSEADLVIPISNHASIDLEAFFNNTKTIKKRPEVKYIELPGETHKFKRTQVLSFKSYEKIILCVSSVQFRKNQLKLIDSFKDFLLMSPQNNLWKLIFIGCNVNTLKDKIHGNENISVMENITDDELDTMYKRAAFSIYPSIDEGFGLPILESLWYGKPCICANFGVMSEVAKKGGCLTIDTKDGLQISNAISLLTSDDLLFERLKLSAIEIEIETWKGYADKVIEMIKFHKENQELLEKSWSLMININHEKTILIVNSKISNCGVYQYGKRLFEILNNGACKYIYKYIEIDCKDEFLFQIEKIKPNVIIYNQTPLTMPWLNADIIESINCAQGTIVHVFNQKLPFDFNIHQNPDYVDSNNNYHILRPIFNYDKKVSETVTSKVIKIGSFGLNMTEKQYPAICQMVVDQFKNKNVEILLHIPHGHFCEGGVVFKQIINECNNIIKNTTIKLSVSTDFMSDNDILMFLGENDLNIFLYKKYDTYRGISSAIDYAISVGKPIAVSNSGMFYHISKQVPSICTDNSSLTDIIKNGFAPLASIKNNWSRENFAIRFDQVINSVIDKYNIISSEEDKINTQPHVDIMSESEKNINDLYISILGRNADELGLKYHKRMLERGLGLDKVKKSLLNSQEFINNSKIETSNCEIKLSICISTYNRSSWLDFSLQNIFMQVHEEMDNIEILVVDNKSTDNTEDICKKYLVNSNFRYIRNNENVGMLGNLNITANAAKGAYIWILGDDDIIKNNSISIIMNELENANEDISMLYMNYSYTTARNASELTDLSKCNNVLPPCKNESDTVRHLAAKSLNLFTAIYCMIFRKDHAIKVYSQDTSGRPFSTLKTCIPTTHYVLNEMINEKIIWIGTPTVVVNYNVSWSAYASLFVMERFPEAFDLAESLGVNKLELDILRNNMIPGFIHYFDELYNNDIHGNCEFFDPARLIQRMGHMLAFKAIIPKLINIYDKAKKNGNKYAQTEIDWKI